MDRIQRALISVTDKTGVSDFARALADMDVEILSTGGTARVMSDAGVKVLEVAAFTGHPEMLDGRVKTLHPKIHAGILYRRDVDSHVGQMAEHHLGPIDLVCVNLYAFEATVANPDVDLAEAIENIDIGGPTLLRAAAKNFSAVTVITEPGRLRPGHQGNEGKQRPDNPGHTLHAGQKGLCVDVPLRRRNKSVFDGKKGLTRPAGPRAGGKPNKSPFRGNIG